MACNQEMYKASRSTVLLEGEKSAMFSVEQGVAQGCERGESSLVSYLACIDECIINVGSLRKD